MTDRKKPDPPSPPGSHDAPSHDTSTRVGFAPGWPRITPADDSSDSDIAVGFAPGWPRITPNPTW